MAVEQQQGAADPVGELEVGVVQQSGEVVPAVVVAGGDAGIAPERGNVQRLAVVVFVGPAQELADLVGGRSAGQSRPGSRS